MRVKKYGKENFGLGISTKPDQFSSPATLLVAAGQRWYLSKKIGLVILPQFLFMAYYVNHHLPSHNARWLEANSIEDHICGN